jgi:deoxyribodipyrimidine photo-lyase
VGLINLLRTCDKVYTCFIFTPEQVGPHNKYKSDNAVQFMIESLADLDADLRRRGSKLMTLYGPTFPILKGIIDAFGVEVVAYNRDYSPYAIARDSDIKRGCSSIKVDCLEYSDYYLYEPGSIGRKTPYQKYTPFYDFVLKREVDEPVRLTPALQRRLTAPSRSPSDHGMTLKEAEDRFVGTPNPDLLVQGGRREAVVRFREALKDQPDYEKNRDLFTYETTFLSAYIKFGCLSIREIYHGFKRRYGLHSGIIRELIWREFFAHVLYGFPEVLRGSFVEKYRHIKWRNSPADFEKWCKGKTGIPIVDACMRQMNTTGYMHNRGRMVVATFLTKTLLLNWRLGEQYFAQKLTDYDPASNNGNWQSVCSTGVDGKPYFRDMNPWIQSAKFDRDAVFIKRWVPELKDVPAKDIQNWSSSHEKYDDKVSYPKPIVDYQEQKPKMLDMYKEA